MTLTASQIKKLRTRARRGVLEVEDLIQLALSGDPTTVPLLDELIAASGTLAGWRDAIAHFMLGGCSALESLTRSKEQVPFALGVLENVKTAEAVATLLGLASRYPSANSQVASALNLVLSFPPAPRIAATLEQCVRVFLEDSVASANTESERATAILGLRGVGDESSLSFLESQRQFTSPYKSTLKLTRTAILRRLASRLAAGRTFGDA